MSGPDLARGVGGPDRSDAPAGRLSAAAERALARLAAALGRPLMRDALLVLVLAALGLSALLAPFDLSRLVNADALQPVQAQYFPILEFRPPPSNNLFPDVLLHILVGTVLPDPLAQKLVVGWAIYAASILLIGLRKGLLAAIAVAAIFALSGFGFLDSASHYALPLMLVLYELARPRLLRNATLFLLVFSDCLLLLPLTLLVLTREDDRRLAEQVAVAAAAVLAGEVFYSEFSAALVKIAAAVPAFAVLVLAARRLGLVRLLCAALAAGLPLAALAGLASERYALPLAACFLLLLVETRPRPFSWRLAALPAGALALFLATFDSGRLEMFAGQYRCLLEALASRGITTLAADHWTAKPLFFAARAAGQKLVITQTDFAEGDTSLWMAPYDFAGAPTRYAVRSPEICAEIEDPAAFCSQDSVAPVVRREELCGGLELFTYAADVPPRYSGRPAGKLDSLRRNLSAYLRKAGIAGS